MKRRIVLMLAVAGALSTGAPALADIAVPDLSNPPSDGSDSRHVCVINDDLDWYRCIYIPLP